jgi:hypothetical protein
MVVFNVRGSADRVLDFMDRYAIGGTSGRSFGLRVIAAILVFISLIWASSLIF